MTVRPVEERAKVKVDKTVVIRDPNDLAYFYSRLDQDRNYQIFKNLASETYARLFKEYPCVSVEDMSKWIYLL